MQKIDLIGHSPKNTNTICEQYLSILYHDIRPAKVQQHKKIITETYGEILYHSVDKLIHQVVLTEEDVFVDLGSGLGKVVVQFFLCSAIKQSCGIEIIPELYQKAQVIKQKVQGSLPSFYSGGRFLHFLLGNFLEIPLTTATVVLVGSPCFSPSMLTSIGNIINQNLNIHSVFTLKPILNLTRLPFKKTIRVECSWDTALCYIYSNKIK